MEEKNYNVYLRDKSTGEVVETLVENGTHEDAYTMVNEYNKGYNRGTELRKDYPINNYEVDVWKI